MNWPCPRHLQDNRCYQVKCVVWCVMPTPRMDAVLQEQANYIHQFVHILVLAGLPFILVPGLTVACHRFLKSPSDQPSPFVVKITDMR